MPTLTAHSNLAKNLAALGTRNADLSEALESVLPHPGLHWFDTAQEVPGASLDGAQLCSRHRPLEEAARQVDGIDLVEHAVVVSMGFGLGWHVKRLAERSAKATLLIVFEPDLSLLRAVLERIDHSSWLKDALVLFITDADDRGMLARKLDGAESILAQGVEFFTHPASRARLGDSAARFANLFTEFINSAKTTLMTTLMRSVDTTRNLMLNLDHYALGRGIADLKDAATNVPAVVVSAGPSLHRNMRLLARPGVRDRCVIIAVQTTLKPLLAAGIRPHFVTALDYHEISKRFYEDLRAEDVEGVTLIADPKAHPVILDAFPGEIRCCANSFLDRLLGPQPPLKRDMGELPAGATVAHLAVYFARYLGCNPIVTIGQDLGFTDGLYYGPGIAIHEVWAPELNPFNTLEMMEWQRIVRHRHHLHARRDVHGRPIYTDAQMHAYLQQFERDFAQYKNEGITIIDATEGGVAKQHTIAMPLAEVMEIYAQGSGFSDQGSAAAKPRVPEPRSLTPALLRRLAEVRRDVCRHRDLSRQTATLLKRMIEDQHDLRKMNEHFTKIDRNRKEVDRRFETFELLNHLNQLGVFNRMKADRRLHMLEHAGNLTPLKKQRAQLERDLANVQWIADAAVEMLEQLDAAAKVLRGQTSKGPNVQASKANAEAARPNLDASNFGRLDVSASSIAALVPVDPHCNGLGEPRSLAEDFNGRTVLQATLERLGRSRRLNSIILIVPERFDVEPLLDRAQIALPVEIERTPGESPFGPERRAIATARLWAPTCWRGGIAGMSVYDEILCPQVMWPIMQKRALTAALLVGPDWPLVQVSSELTLGCDRVIERRLEHPEQLNLVFTQAPPGLCGCVISASLMQELSQRNRLSTVGGLLAYQPHAPQGDPIARDANVQIDHKVRQSFVRATFDSPRQVRLLRASAQGSRVRDQGSGSMDQRQKPEPRSLTSALSIIAALEPSFQRPELPQHITLELTTQRISNGVFRRFPPPSSPRLPLSLELAERLFVQVQRFAGDLSPHLTLDGAGDPLLQPQFDDIIRLARRHGIRGVHVRTELLVEQPILDRLLACDVDVISVDLNADRAETYRRMMGVDRFRDVLMNMQYVIDHRRALTAHPGTAGFALPWLVPHLQRRCETYEDIEPFFDRWQHTLGAAVIEGPPPWDRSDTLAPAVTPQRVVDRQRNSGLTIFCDGSVPADPTDANSPMLGNLAVDTIETVWSKRRDG